jgi:hypothetical protein
VVALQAPEPLQGVGDLRLLVAQLLGVVQVLPGAAAADTEVLAAGGDASRSRLQQFDRTRLGVAALELGDPGPHPVSRQRLRNEHDQLAVTGNAAAAVGEAVDHKLQLLVAGECGHGLPGSLRAWPSTSSPTVTTSRT